MRKLVVAAVVACLSTQVLSRPLAQSANSASHDGALVDGGSPRRSALGTKALQTAPAVERFRCSDELSRALLDEQIEQFVSALDSDSPDERSVAQQWLRARLETEDFALGMYVERALLMQLQIRPLSTEQKRAFRRLLRPNGSESLVGRAIAENLRRHGKQLSAVAEQASRAYLPALKAADAASLPLKQDRNAELKWFETLRGRLKKNLADEGLDLLDLTQDSNGSARALVRGGTSRYYLSLSRDYRLLVDQLTLLDGDRPKLLSLEPGGDLRGAKYRRLVMPPPNPLQCPVPEPVSLGQVFLRRSVPKAPGGATDGPPVKEQVQLVFDADIIGEAFPRVFGWINAIPDLPGIAKLASERFKIGELRYDMKRDAR